MNLQEVYKGKKVFITGHTGFKGSWLLTWLYQLGAVVKGYSLAPLHYHELYYAVKGEELCESVLADIRDKEKLQTEILSFQPDYIFHLAAQPLVRLSYQIPAETFEINAQGTVHLLDALRFLEKPCSVVMITTDKVYLNKEIDYHYKESDDLGGYDPYSASKACSELIIDAYRNSFFHPSDFNKHKKSISVARAGNVIGGGDWAKDRIIPDIVRALTDGNPVEVRNPTSVRPWQHVMEPLYAYLILGAHQQQNPVKYGDSFNLGPHNSDVLTVGELVEKAIECWGDGNYILFQNLVQPHEAGLLQLDISKALSMLDWHPKLNADEAIEKTIAWYKQFVLQGADARELIKNQIKEFTRIQ